MKIKEIKQNLLRNLGNIFLHTIINVLCKTVRVNRINYSVIEKLLNENQNFVLAFWHGTMLVPWYFHKGQNFSALISQSKDGSLLANSLKKWGYKVTRGSSHRGGKEALETLIENSKNNFSIAITPDGPTGPPRVMKAGAVITAQRSGIPLVLCGVASKRKFIFRSWDKFEVPKFFSKVNMTYSDPIIVEKDISKEDTSAIIDDCNKKLNQLQDDADKIS